MPASLIWTPQSEEDLLDIYVTIGIDNPTAADRIYDRLRDAIRLLCDNPRLGAARPEVGKFARILVHPPYLILYRVRPDDEAGPVSEVEIIRIVDGRRDLAALF
ncbi:type II toxin-antitoxin system RelE/ParE family toxin [Labrys sp. LIt4]|uniref:type II toxin-antitoxin system RelE/ParE family toxin n=1 Tax=Labrys sp. LIt4 TaxID=2821355 RepID=UPI001ADFACBC|nr:type II toxin-antitoxin system RelE/ParE family toxin [Labrys sp. LIt4]MBP0577957.1 type II toxin-antitoxin system RelE/ParE family toxin [Labrys sp. LIt4]